MDELFAQVETTYRHRPKQVQAAAALRSTNAHLKWYLIHPEDLPISTAEMREAQAFLLKEMHTGRLELTKEVGFVVQHRVAAHLILYVCTWRGNNEVWETLYHHDFKANTGYKRFEREATSPTFCVWVLAAVSHEQQAWSRYLESDRDETAQQQYLNDQFSGPTR